SFVSIYLLPGLAGLVSEKARGLPDAFSEPLLLPFAPVRIPHGPEALEAIAQHCAGFRTRQPSLPRERPFKVSFRYAAVSQQTRFHPRHPRARQHGKGHDGDLPQIDLFDAPHPATRITPRLERPKSD